MSTSWTRRNGGRGVARRERRDGVRAERRGIRGGVLDVIGPRQRVGHERIRNTQILTANRWLPGRAHFGPREIVRHSRWQTALLFRPLNRRVARKFVPSKRIVGRVAQNDDSWRHMQAIHSAPAREAGPSLFSRQAEGRKLSHNPCASPRPRFEPLWKKPTRRATEARSVEPIASTAGPRSELLAVVSKSRWGWSLAWWFFVEPWRLLR
jgi:hypothetical protein